MIKIVKQNAKDITDEILTFNTSNFHEMCDFLANCDQDLKSIIENHGYPPMWNRENTFETLVHIILEQQVSLASALAALHKLKEKITEITPEKILSLTDAEMRECYVSRQKNTYIKSLANSILEGKINLEKFQEMSDEKIRETLIRLKGIGNWTIDIYLMLALQRTDIFPIGDLAVVNALKKIRELPPKISREEIITISEEWKPLRSVATMILWHYYLSDSASKK
ncbi:DNA-3-methyladenine glycosylase family protein [Chryseobacterium gambrini]|uniref:DNA-3-methyladenine glycosylase family protein n=1 Tax=Chryseobacterium gambrini TaxID=373672 RepID=UPI0022F16072|nr:DNA-3-methyladenine glycosylase 2 family protein [Chryseobacterium gambrini]WBV52816.1 DNA-3-methyladenine glycosylase 2 family protein [Chryseobacterium gambrini]